MLRASVRIVLTLSILAALCCSTTQGQPPNRDVSPDELFKRSDTDHDGLLDFEEWAAFMQLHQRQGAEKRQPATRPSQASRPAPRGVRFERDVEYGKADERALTLDMLLPTAEADRPRPAIVFIHGGGWRGGNKNSGHGRLIPLVASGRYVGVSVGYRLSGEAKWPAQIHDCKAAIRFVRAHAEQYGIDPERIGVWGSSAGGHLVNMLGTSGDVEPLEGDCGSADQSSRVTCVVAFCGPANLAHGRKFEGGREPSAVTLLLGGRPDEMVESAKAASPITYISKDDPPFLLVHGTADGTVPFVQATSFEEALRAAEVDVTLYPIEGGGHGIGGEAVMRRVDAFLAEHLLP